VVVEKFTHHFIASRVLDIYVGTAFFATLIFFVLNANAFNPLEIIFGVIMVTIGFKGLGHFVMALVISLFNIDNQKEKIDFDEKSARIDGLMNDLALQQTKIKTNE
jgi:hypothetical protein